MESLCECGIEPPESISHELVSYMGSVQTQKFEEFGSLLSFSVNPGPKNQLRLGTRRAEDMSLLNWLDDSLPLSACGHVNMSQ